MLPSFPHECALELLKLSYNVDECKPLPLARRFGALAAGATACAEGLAEIARLVNQRIQ